MNNIKKTQDNVEYELCSDDTSIDNVLKNAFHNFYDHLPQKYIIDRNGGWGTISNLEMLEKYFPNDLKFIVPVRDILEILSSYCLQAEKSNSYNFLDEGIDFHCYNYRTKNDKICDFLMKPGEIFGIDMQLFSVYNLLEKCREKIHLVEYKDLVRNPRKEINKIYEFLDIPKFDHDFDNITQFEYNGKRYNDMKILGVPLHQLRENKITRSTNNPYKVLSSYAIKKYSGMEFWRK